MDDHLTLDELEFSVRLHNCLENDSFRWAWQLRRTPDKLLLRIPNFGKVSLAELRQRVPYDLRGEPPLADDWEQRRHLNETHRPIDWIDVIAGVAP